MAKPFLTYEQQLDKLIHEKRLMVVDNDYALALLKDIGYFALIGGYKDPFINPMTRLFRYLLPSESFIKFKKSLKSSIDKYCSSTTRITRTQFLSMMGFPANWENITRYKP